MVNSESSNRDLELSNLRRLVLNFLKLQYFGHIMQRVDSLEKTLMLRGIGGRRKGDDRGWDGWMASPTRWTWVWVNSGRWWWTGRPGVLWFMGLQRVGQDWVTELNWTDNFYQGGKSSKEAPGRNLFVFHWPWLGHMTTTGSITSKLDWDCPIGLEPLWFMFWGWAHCCW